VLLSELARRLELPRLEWYDAVDSTQDCARAIAQENGEEWTTVVADHQRQGRGQWGRNWEGEAGHGLAFSILLRPGSIEGLAVLPIRVGLAIVRTLARYIAPPSRLMVKWPNDLMIDRPGWAGKVGGILCEGQVRGDECMAIIGIGINVFPFAIEDESFNEPIAFLADHLVSKAERAPLFELIVAGLRKGLRWSDSELGYGEIMEYERYDWLRGHRVIAPVVGTAWGITRTGALAVQTSKGGWETVLTGRVRRGR